MKKKKYIILTADICEDVYAPKDPWGYLDKIKNIRKQIINKLKSNYGREIRFTWFVRADYSIKEEFGKITALLDKKIWQKFQKEGDEIGWHIHFYKKAGSKYVQETNINKIIKEAQESYKEIKKRFKISSVRVGKLYSHNLLLKKFYELGIKVDANCLPNRKRDEPNMWFDWAISPTKPYYPSEKDYRRPVNPKKGEKQIGILEVPYSTLIIKADYDKEPIRRYLNIAFKSKYLQDNILQLDRLKPIVIIFHPFELLKHKKKQTLLSFDIDEVMDNLSRIIKHYKRKGIEIEFITLKDILNIT